MSRSPFWTQLGIGLVKLLEAAVKSSQAEAARQLGVTTTSLRAWIEQFRSSGELPREGESTPLADELKRLREQNRRLQLENDILKKAAAYFAQESL